MVVIRWRVLRLSLVFAVVAIGMTAHASDGVSQMVQRIADLRAEVEAMNVEIEAVKKEGQGKVDALLARKNELEGEKLKEQGRRIQVEAKIQSLEKRLARVQARSGQDRVRLEKLIARARTHVDAVPPIAREARLGRLAEIERDIQGGEVSLESGITELWRWLEAELQASVSTRIVRESIAISGGEPGSQETRPAEILAIGNIVVLFADDKGRFGRGFVHDGDWRFHLFEDPSKAKVAMAAFEAERNKKSLGFVEIPELKVQR